MLSCWGSISTLAGFLGVLLDSAGVRAANAGVRRYFFHDGLLDLDINALGGESTVERGQDQQGQEC